MAAMVIFVFLYCLSWRWLCNRRTEFPFQEWQQKTGYKIVGKRLRFFYFTGPFLASSSVQAVYRLTLCDHDGELRKAWACCGTWFGGVLSNPVTIQVIVDEW
jgi:hypothetical protein